MANENTEALRTGILMKLFQLSKKMPVAIYYPENACHRRKPGTYIY
jgi:hypothetical protein